jgi:hypothetical protein
MLLTGEIMETLNNYRTLFSIVAVAAIAVNIFGSADAATGAYIVAAAVVLYILWAAFGRTQLQQRRVKNASS